MFGSLKGRFKECDTEFPAREKERRPLESHDAHHSAAAKYDGLATLKKDIALSDATATGLSSVVDSSSTSFASISLAGGHVLDLISFPLDLQEVIRTSMIESWPKGIKKDWDRQGSRVFKFRGWPWTEDGDDAIYARRLIRGILKALFERGWVLYVASQIFKSANAMDVLFFQYHSQPLAKAKTEESLEWFSITFSKHDRVRFIDAPQRLIDSTIDTFGDAVQKHGPFRLPGTYEIQLKTFGTSGGAADARVLCMKMLSVIERQGWRLYASMCQRLDSSGKGESTDTWHVMKSDGQSS